MELRTLHHMNQPADKIQPKKIPNDTKVCWLKLPDEANRHNIFNLITPEMLHESAK